MAIMTKAAARRAAKKRADGRHAWMLGFGLIVVPFLIGAGVLLLQAAPPPLHVPEMTATTEDHTEPLPRIYLEMPEPLSVAVTPQGPRVQIVLAVALRGALAQLAPLKDEVTAKGDVLLAALLREAQEMVRAGADSDALHRDLPARLRKVLNDALGTEALAEPVEEVLITTIFIQQ